MQVLDPAAAVICTRFGNGREMGYVIYAEKEKLRESLNWKAGQLDERSLYSLGFMFSLKHDITRIQDHHGCILL